MSSSVCSNITNSREVNGQPTEQDVVIAAFTIAIVLIKYSTSNILHNGSWSTCLILRITAYVDILSLSQYFQQCYCYSMVSLFRTVRTAFITCLGCDLDIINCWSWNFGFNSLKSSPEKNVVLSFQSDTLYHELLGIFFIFLPIIMTPHCQPRLT